MKLTETHYSRTNVDQRSSSSRSLLRVKFKQLGGGFKNYSCFKENLSCLSKGPNLYNKSVSVMSTQIGSLSKVENEESGEVLAKVWNAWKRIKLEKMQKVQIIRKKLVKFLRQKKKFLQFICSQNDKKLKIRCFSALKTLKTLKVPPKKIFLKKYLKAWQKHKKSVKKLYQVSFVLQEKTCHELEKKLFIIWKNKFKTLKLSLNFFKKQQRNKKKLVFSLLRTHSKAQKLKQKLVKRILFQKNKSIFSYSFLKWLRFSSFSTVSILKIQLSSLKTSHFLQQCEIKELHSRISDLSTTHQILHQDTQTRENELKHLLKRHAEELYKSICS